LGMQQYAPHILYNPDDTLFSDISIGVHRGAPAYFMTLKDGAQLEGFYFAHEDGQLALVLRRRRPLASGNYPFAGFTFVVDAGHGGSDPGALGASGTTIGFDGRPFTEAAIVLRHALLLQERLEMLGAEVIMVRDADTALHPRYRVPISRAAKPDMYISLHANSTAETTNATNIRGFTIWYRNPNSLSAAQEFMRSMRYVNPYTNRANNVNQANFYVCRPVWAPSILLEASFMNNINDFVWLINPQEQSNYVWGIVNALLRYYSS